MQRLILFLVMLCLSIGIAAQDEEPETEAFQVVPFFVYEYDFEAEADEILSIVAQSQGSLFDLQLTVIDEDGEVIAESDDRPSILNLAMPEAGTYTVRVQNKFWTEGEAQLVLIRGEATEEDALIETEGSTDTGTVGVETINGVAAPIQPGVCIATVESLPARLRSLPTTANARNVQRELLPGQSLNVDGQYDNPDDGFIWYRMEGFLWGRSDVLTLLGDCDDIRPIFL